MEKIPNAVYTRELKERGGKDDRRGWIKGIRIPINDVWIAASCMSVGGILLTG